MNSYYAATLLVYAAVDIIACLALNLQFGLSGIVNFSFIVFQAIGAYTAAVLSMPPDTANGAYQVYVGGFQLPFPIPSQLPIPLPSGFPQLPFPGFPPASPTPAPSGSK